MRSLLFLWNKIVTVMVAITSLSGLLNIDNLMSLNGVAAQEQEQQPLVDSPWNPNTSKAKHVLLLFHDDSERSERLLSEFEITKRHFATVEGEENGNGDEEEELISFISINASETSDAMALSKNEYSIVAFPTLKWIVHGVTCDFLGGLSNRKMIRWINSRIENSVVFLYDDHDDNDANEINHDDHEEERTKALRNRLEHAKGNADLVVVGFFDSLHQVPPLPRSNMDSFVAVSQEDRGLDCTFIAMENNNRARHAAGVLGMNETSTSSDYSVFAIHRIFTHETQKDSEPIPFETGISNSTRGVGRQALHRFVEDNRVPLIPIYSSKNAAAIISSAYRYYVFILVPSLAFLHSTTTTTESLIQDVISHAAEDFRRNNNQVRFVAVPYNDSDEATKHLFLFFDLEPTDTPAIRMLSTKHNNVGETIDDQSILKYNQPLEGYTLEGVTSFVQKHMMHDTTTTMRTFDSASRPDNHGDEL